mmetsp:Transcript_63071/g.133144  ORF Transcript_63071/g.133144 Transcript_63071/m.133144 type:complete len:351 (-) Transcript_63071:125-1177(-)
MARGSTTRKERHSGDPKSSIKAPAKKAGGGGKYTMGKVGDEDGGTFIDRGDPNFVPEEKRIDPEDGSAYTYDQLAAFYKGKFSKQAIAEYWEYTCTPTKRAKAKAKAKVKAKDQSSFGPTVAESVKAQPKTKGKWVPKDSVKSPPKRLTPEDLEGNGPLAKEVAAVIPYFPYKKLDKFYDIQGLMKYPKLFDAVCTAMAKRYRKMGVTKIAAFEARGFLFATVSIKLGVPFVLLRKDGKLPNSMSSAPYTKEYEGVESICIQNGAIVEGDKVLLIDDLIATGGTLCAGIELVKALKAEVIECGCLIQLKELNGAEKCLKAGAKSVWGFITDDLLTTKAELPSDYKDDGKP